MMKTTMTDYIKIENWRMLDDKSKSLVELNYKKYLIGGKIMGKNYYDDED